MQDDELTLFDAVSASTNPENDLQSAESLLSLMSLPGIGSGRALRLAEGFNSWDALLSATPEEVRRVARARVDIGWRPAPPEVPASSYVVGWFQNGYPLALKDIPNPPAVLWVRGDLRPDERCVAIVGTRSPTQWGTSMAASIAAEAAGVGVCVVSGLAKGIDIAAHRAALQSGGRTVAVLGSGVDRPTPFEHERDAQSILESGGAVISEMPPGTVPSARSLVSRNRIQSGLSFATIVVQCATNSGTMHTARFAREQNRRVASPVPPDNESELDTNSGNLELCRPAFDTAQVTPPAQALTSREALRALLTA